MKRPIEHKTVQARILKYAQEIGWTYVPRGEAERRRGFDPAGATPEERAWNSSLFFGNLLHQLMTALVRIGNWNPEGSEPLAGG
ncbi:MAG: hypothetical protein Q8O04_03935 [Deltaproteobacteria bacterium]|nr:hypothetical protein [Deltaproteobacteria bacterium]